MVVAGRCCWGAEGAAAVGRVGERMGAEGRPPDLLRGIVDVVWVCCEGWSVVEGSVGISVFGSLEKMANRRTNQGWRNWARGAEPR